MTAETAVEEQPQEWFFTFGAEIPALEHCYVRFHGTYMEARMQMLARFGRNWCSQYESETDVPHGLTELVLPLQEATR